MSIHGTQLQEVRGAKTGERITCYRWGQNVERVDALQGVKGLDIINAPARFGGK